MAIEEVKRVGDENI